MEYIGKKLIKYGDREVLADEYLITIPEELFHKMLNICSKEELESIKRESVKNQLFEQAALIRDKLEQPRI